MKLNPKKVAFFHSHLFWIPHFETELELINKFQKSGSEVISYVCNAGLKKCDSNVNGSLKTCFQCILKRKNGFNLLDKEVREVPIILKYNKLKLQIPNSITDLKQLYYLNYDVGYAILSSIITIFRNPHLKISEHKKYFDDFLHLSISLYDFFLESLKKEKPDLVVIFNGRFVYTRALVRVCEYLNIEYVTHERGSNFDKYMLFNNSLPHDLKYLNSLIDKYWQESGASEDKVLIAESFYKARLNASNKDWIPFIKNQNFEELPIDFNFNKINISVFLSSDDEFMAISDSWERPLFESQMEGINFLLDFLGNNPKYQIYFRMHPNSIKDKILLNNLYSLNFDNIMVIEPKSTISSYKLLRNSNINIVFGSTIGVESCFWGIPCINLDNAMYYNLDVTYNPNNKTEIISLLNENNLVPKPILGALKYGYFFNTFGAKFDFFMPSDYVSGTIKNIDIKELFSIKRYMKFWINKFFSV